MKDFLRFETKRNETQAGSSQKHLRNTRVTSAEEAGAKSKNNCVELLYTTTCKPKTMLRAFLLGVDFEYSKKLHKTVKISFSGQENLYSD